MLSLFALSMPKRHPQHKGNAALHVTNLAVHNFRVMNRLEAATAAAAGANSPLCIGCFPCRLLVLQSSISLIWMVYLSQCAWHSRLKTTLVAPHLLMQTLLLLVPLRYVWMRSCMNALMLHPSPLHSCNTSCLHCMSQNRISCDCSESCKLSWTNFSCRPLCCSERWCCFACASLRHIILCITMSISMEVYCCSGQDLLVLSSLWRKATHCTPGEPVCLSNFTRIWLRL